MAKYAILNEIRKYFGLKEESIGDDSQYIGGKIGMVELENIVEDGDFGSKQYVKASVNNVVIYLENGNRKLATKTPTMILSGYRPKIGVTLYSDAEEES